MNLSDLLPVRGLKRFTVLSRAAWLCLGLPASLAADTLLNTTTFNYAGQTVQNYTVPAEADYIVIRAWGAGGGSAIVPPPISVTSTGGNGAYVSASYNVAAGDQFAISVGGGGAGFSGGSANCAGGWPGGGGGKGSNLVYPNVYGSGGGGGGFSAVRTPYGTVVAGGGGGGAIGSSPGDWYGGDGGTPNGSAGQGGLFGYGATQTSGGAGGNSGPNYGSCLGASGTFEQGGDGYSTGGAGGGGGVFGGGGGSRCPSYLSNYPFGSGGGGSSCATGPAYSIVYLNGGRGGYSGGNGGNGAVVILAYKYSTLAAPVLSGLRPQCVQPNQPISFWVAAQNHPASFAATGLPTGLTLNTATGEIAGTPTAAGDYSSMVSATNASGTATGTLVWHVDNIAPSVPTGLQLTTGLSGPNPTSTSFSLSWNASADNSGVAVLTYEVQRDAVSLGTTSATSMSVTGLAAATTYAMSVRACDAAGNWSGWSAPFSVTTLVDSSPPSVPTGLHTSNLSATFLTLEWTPSADDVGVTDYEVQRNGTSLGTTGGVTSLSVTGLAPTTTYTFAVRARDGAGNWSAWSTPALSVATVGAGADTLLESRMFTYAGRLTQSYTTPAGTSYVVIKAWGAGGGGCNSNSHLVSGGNAGCTTATYDVTAGAPMTISVGNGGVGGADSNPLASRSGGWPGGGGSSSVYSGAGGGYSSVVTTSGTLWAAAGGGAGPCYLGSYYCGGYGGGVNGGNGWGSTPGRGASVTAGGNDGGNNPSGSLGQGGSGGGGGGYYGGGGGYSGGGGGGSSYVTGPAYNIVYQDGSGLPGWISDPGYPGNGVGYGGCIISGMMNGGDGAVLIRAYQTPGTDLIRTFVPTGSTQTYTIPAGADSVVIKTWGAGGGSGAAGSNGGAGAYVTATCNVSPGQTINILAGPGGPHYPSWTGSGGGASVVTLPSGTSLYAAGGGGGGTMANGNGGAGGAPNGQAGGTANNATGGGGGITHGSGSGTYGTGGAGGTGNGEQMQDQYDENGNYTGTDTVSVGNGRNGGVGLSDDGGYPGSPGDNTPGYWGGQGGGGLGGGGGGGGGDNYGGGSGGGGGSSGIVVGTLVPTASQMLAGSGSAAPNTNDVNYPGNNVGNGGTSGGGGGDGAVVVIVHFQPPTITSSLNQSVLQNAPVNYVITATNAPTSYAAQGLPSGLTLDSGTGIITGAVATPGTYNSIISATNRGGTGQANLTWNILADTVPPTVPTGLQASSITAYAFVLTWAPSTDNVAVTGYEVQCDGLSQGVVSAAMKSFGGFAPGSTHSVAVRAGDAAGNWSAWSAPLSVTVSSDTQAPTAAANLVSAAVASSAVTLMWDPASDNLGVSGYNIYRDSQLIGTTSDTVYVDVGLAPGSNHAYTVKAFDAAGNLSTASQTLSVTTDANASADLDHDGVPDSVETILFPGGHSAVTPDAANQLQLKIQRPSR
jgi:chitodextrinase